MIRLHSTPAPHFPTLDDTLATSAAIHDMDRALDRLDAAIGTAPTNRARLVLADITPTTWYALTNRQRRARLMDYASTAILYLGR